MGDKTSLYFSLLMMYQALQSQFMSYMENPSGLMTAREMNVYEGSWTRLHLWVVDFEDSNQEKEVYAELMSQLEVDFEGLNELTEMEEQSVELEDILQNTMKELSRFRRGGSRYLRYVRKLLRQVRQLQAELRAAIRTLRARSTGQFPKRRNSRSRSMLDLKNIVESQMRTRWPWRFKSCPDIPSEFEDPEFDFESVTKCKSMNRSLDFKGAFERLHRKILEATQKLYQSLTRKKTSTLPTQNQPHQAHHGPGSASSPQSSSQGAEPCLGSESNQSDSSRATDTAFSATRNSSEPTGQNHSQTMHHQRMVHPDPGHQGQANSTSSSQAPGPSLRSESPSSVSDSSTARGAACRTTSHSSGQSEQHHSSAMNRRHSNQRQNPEVDSSTHRHHSHSNNPSVSPSQNVTGISHSQTTAQMGSESNNPRVRKAMEEKAPTTQKEDCVSDQSNGSPSFSVADISSVIYKTLAASCTVFLILL